MASVGNNINADIANARDSFLTKEEQAYFEELLKSPSDRIIHYHLMKNKAEVLHKKAVELMDNAEAGLYSEEEMAKIERGILHYLMAIEDLHMELIKERNEIPNENNELSR